MQAPESLDGRAGLRPRSLVFDLFGDYVDQGSTVKLQVLVDLLESFGVPPPTTRVVVARLRRDGFLAATRVGRQAAYFLTPHSQELLTTGRSRIFSRERSPWDGKWRVVIYNVPESDRAARDRLRKHLAWLGFGPLAPSTWVSPHDRLEQACQRFEAEGSARVDVLVAESRGRLADLDMAQRCWDLEALQRDFLSKRDAYRRDLERFSVDPPRGEAALVERVTLVSQYRRLPFRDPDLPVELLPPDWAGREAHELFTQAYQLLSSEAEAYYGEVWARYQ